MLSHELNRTSQSISHYFASRSMKMRWLQSKSSWWLGEPEERQNCPHRGTMKHLAHFPTTNSITHRAITGHTHNTQFPREQRWQSWISFLSHIRKITNCKVSAFWPISIFRSDKLIHLFGGRPPPPTFSLQDESQTASDEFDWLAILKYLLNNSDCILSFFLLG
jgi:hypothetical protein